ncbi:MAG TPA: CHASE2 domain-containing protein, partial [Candidatus Binatia bacterium]
MRILVAGPGRAAGWAQLVDKIGALGAASVGIDMIFAEPDETPPTLTQQTTKTLAEPRAASGALTPNDAALAAVLGRGVFVLGYQMRFGVERAEGRSCMLHPIPVVSLQEPGAMAQPGLFESSATLCSLSGLGK